MNVNVTAFKSSPSQMKDHKAEVLLGINPLSKVRNPKQTSSDHHPPDTESKGPENTEWKTKVWETFGQNSKTYNGYRQWNVTLSLCCGCRRSRSQLKCHSTFALKHKKTEFDCRISKDKQKDSIWLWIISIGRRYRSNWIGFQYVCLATMLLNQQ